MTAIYLRECAIKLHATGSSPTLTNIRIQYNDFPNCAQYRSGKAIKAVDKTDDSFILALFGLRERDAEAGHEAILLLMLLGRKLVNSFLYI